MNKKIILTAVLLLAVVVVFAACGKDDYEVSYTVPGTNGEVIEVYKDNEGNEFVTNADGDKIPVTTDKDGFYDDITSLITQTTTTKSNKENNTTTTTAPTSTTTTTTTAPDKDNSTTTTTKKAITINGNGGQDSVKWEDIVNAGKK